MGQLRKCSKMAPIIPLPAIDDKQDRARAEATHSICSIRLESRFNCGGETRRRAPLYEVAVLTLPLRSSLPHPTAGRAPPRRSPGPSP